MNGKEKEAFDESRKENAFSSWSRKKEKMEISVEEKGHQS